MANSNPVQAQEILQTALVDTTSGAIIRQWYPFFSQIQSLISNNYQPVFDVTQYGATGNGSSADDVGINQAIRAAVTAGGGTIYFPPVPVFYKITSPLIFNSTVPITVLGSYTAGLVVRGANMPEGQGVLDMAGAQNLNFVNIAVDGFVTTPVGVAYSQLAPSYDPMTPLLSNNSTFWLHDGCQFISFNHCLVQHTGGYALVAQAKEIDITDLNFYQFDMLNNRPNLFGINPGDLNYGSWTGGVLFEGNGLTSTAMIRRANFLSCSARRCTGNAFWQHLYGFSSMHEEISFTDILGVDLGRDLIQPGGTVEMRISGVTGRRIGYITTDDTSPSTSAWLSDQWAVCIDAGTCYGLTMDNIHVVSCAGGVFDIDGCEYVTLSNFSIRNPVAGDPEFIEDGVGLVGWANAATAGGPNASYGILMAQATYNVYGEGNHQIGTGNIVNCSNGAVKMYGTHNNLVTGLNINHPANGSGPPISIGNLGAPNSQRSYGNSITNCRMQYDPSVANSPCVNEDASIAPFQASDINQVLGLQLFDPTGNAIPFKKAASSGSIGAVTGTFTSGTLTITNGYVTGL